MKVAVKVAVIDLDGVCADSTNREKQARSAGNGRMHWPTMFNPALVGLDVPIPGAAQTIKQLRESGYQVFFLTSRPEAMREATEEWLKNHKLDYHQVLVMKSISAQYIKTRMWKAQEISQLVSQLQPDEVMFVDDEPDNRAAVEALNLPGLKLFAALSQVKGDINGR